jgi:hypothetical protein
LGEGSARDEFWLTSGDGAVRLLEQSKVPREPVAVAGRGWWRRKPKPTGEQAWFLPTPTSDDVGLIITAARSIAPATRLKGFLIVDDVNAPDAVQFTSPAADGAVLVVRDGQRERLADVVATGVTLRRTRR